MIRKIEVNNYKSEKGDDWNFILSYELFGKSVGNAPVVLVNHSLTGNSNLIGEKGWWKHLVGKKKLIDSEIIRSLRKPSEKNLLPMKSILVILEGLPS